MKDIFYSIKDKTVFWVAGYVGTGNGRAIEIANALKTSATRFADKLGIDPAAIHTTVVEKSSKYKNMRVFFVQEHEIDTDKADMNEVIGLDWTMMKWLNN